MSEPRTHRLIVCLDGTNNQIGKGLPTNVGKTYRLLKLSQPGVQNAYYDPGIGTLPDPTVHGAVARQVSTVLELGLGWGIRRKLASAYTWLMNHYQHGNGQDVPRSQIYVFGFSRGAFTARALVGMLNRVGLLRPGSDNLVPYAIEHYTVNQRRYTAHRLEQTAQFSDSFCWGTPEDPLSPPWPGVEHHQNQHAVPVEYLGVWDTVEAIGLPSRGRLDWEGTHTLRNVRRIRHAVSIDEWRRPYREFLTTNPRRNPLVDGAPDRSAAVQEVWFPGVHCDVGGTYRPDDRLSTSAFEWVLDAVHEEFLMREDNSYALACTPSGGAPDPVHPHGLVWNLVGRRRRPIDPGSWIHASARTLLDGGGAYRPRNLPADRVWWNPPPASVPAPSSDRVSV